MIAKPISIISVWRTHTSRLSPSGPDGVAGRGLSVRGCFYNMGLTSSGQLSGRKSRFFNEN